MKFFLPHANYREEAAQVYEAVRRFAAETTGHQVLDRRIYHIRYKHEGSTYQSTVGQPDRRAGEEVIAILEGTATYLVCTSTRGVVRGVPLLIGKDEALVVVDFEED